MPRLPLNISAALAIAIERQVEDIIAQAKAECALRIGRAARPGLDGREAADFAPQAPIEALEPDIGLDLDEAAARFWFRQDIDPTPRPRSESRGSAPRFVGRVGGGGLDFWKRLRSLWADRAFRR